MFLWVSKIASSVATFALCSNLNDMSKCDSEFKQLLIWQPPVPPLPFVVSAADDSSGHKWRIYSDSLQRRALLTTLGRAMLNIPSVLYCPQQTQKPEWKENRMCLCFCSELYLPADLLDYGGKYYRSPWNSALRNPQVIQFKKNLFSRWTMSLVDVQVLLCIFI